jgi:hypothetical protein
LKRSWPNFAMPIIVGVSLVLAVPCVVFWLVTLNDLYLTGWGDPRPGHPFCTFGSGGGRFQLVYDNGTRGATPLGHWGVLGLEYGRFNSGWNLWVPWWLPTALFCVAPALWSWRAWRRVKRPRTSLCPVCGYDLRASPERCPECGRANQIAVSQSWTH